jgi:transposase-like protein
MERWTADKAREVLARWRTSGESARTYGRKHGIDAQRLFYWRRKLGNGAKRGPKRSERAIARLVPAVVRVEGATGDERAVVVRLPSRVIVEVDTARVRPEWVGALVGELARR